MAGDGDDLIVAASGAGNDDYRGGDGEDTAAFESATKTVKVDLAEGTAFGNESDSDTLDGIEHVVGGAGNDRITGDDEDNDLAGGDGNDRLAGDDGEDTLTGGFGKDVLTGGAGGDVFVYGSFAESPAGKKTRDTLKDFDPLEDIIDLPGDVDYIGADPFSGGGGEARFQKGALQVDADGDREADLEIALSKVKLDDLGTDPDPDWLG